MSSKSTFLKVVLLGDGGVGKSSLMNRFVSGNKIDVADRVVTQEEAHNFCQEIGGIPYYETSAKDSTNVDIAFHAAVKRLNELEQTKAKNDFSATEGVNLSNVKQRESSSCCE